MNEELLIECFRQLSENTLNAFLKGQALLLVDDESLSFGSTDQPNVLVAPGQIDAENPEILRTGLIDNAAEIYANYYGSHPLSYNGFDRQVLNHYNTHGFNAFTAVAGSLPEMSLFVEQGMVLALDRTDPRHPYGTYCELAGSSASDEAIREQVERWVSSGQAYDSYISMNVCKFNC